MSDSDEPRVTHTEISSPYKDLSDIGSPRADDHEFPDAPPSPEDQPYAEDASPIAQSPDYVPESDPEADPEEDDDEDPEEDPIDYSADGGDDGDDEMDIEEDEDDEMEDEEAEEEHSAPAYPVVVALPATAPSAEETEPFETDESAATPPPHPAYRMTARITIPEPLPVPAWSDSEVARLLAISSPPASPLSPWSSSPPQIPFPLSPPPPVLTAPPPSPIRSLGYRAATIRMRAEAAATSHSLPLPPPFILSPTRPDAPPPLPTSAPTSFPPLSLPTDSHREGRPEVNLPPRMGLGLALGPGYEVGESSAAAAARPAGGFRADYGFVATMDRQIRRDPERYVGYGITDSWDEIVETLQGAPVSTDTELGAHMREFESMVRRDTDEIYTRLDDEQGQRQLLAGRKMAPKRATRSTRAPPTPNETTTTVTEAQLQALIDQGVAAAMAEAESAGLGMATIAMVSGTKASPNCSRMLLLEILEMQTFGLKGMEVSSDSSLMMLLHGGSQLRPLLLKSSSCMTWRSTEKMMD
ncbi:hypothetical protein Tco_1540951 [Tanacetum coccineum]